MLKPEHISIQDARHMVVKCQGLNNEASTPAPIQTIKQVGYIQIDTISVVERAHHHTFYVRSPEYTRSHIDHMLSVEKSIFEYWSHAASYLPMEDFRFSLVRKAEFAKGDNHWYQKDKKVARFVLKKIMEEGPLQSKDFEDNYKHPKGVWSWKPTKRALEQLFMEGKLMTAKRVGFQKVYDLTERVLPAGTNTTRPTRREFCRHLITKTIQAQGLVTEREMTYLRKGLQPTLGNTLKLMLSAKEIVKVQVDGLDFDYYASKETLDRLQEKWQPEVVHILSPFDNLVIQRDRVKQLFRFDYQIECYVPEAKRKFGYFCLPILFGKSFAGRLDAKADRKTGVFHIKNIWLEQDFNPDEVFLEMFCKKLIQYATFCGCSRVNIMRSSPKSLKSALTSILKGSVGN